MGGGAAEWVNVDVGLGVADVEGLGDVELAAAGTTLCVGDGLGADVEVAALPHPAARTATSASAATFREVTVGEVSVTPFGQARAKGPCVTARNPLSICRNLDEHSHRPLGPSASLEL